MYQRVVQKNENPDALGHSALTLNTYYLEKLRHQKREWFKM
jgi:hypothetical protein